MDYDETLAAKIREKRNYREEADGTVFCSIGGCSGSSGLRCHRTGVPICTKCSVRTPVGYISREAAREQQDKFYDATPTDYVIAVGTAFFSNLFIGFFATRIVWILPGFFGLILLFFIASSAAGLISEIIWRALRKKRGRNMPQAIGAAMIFSTFLLLSVTPFLALLLYGFIATSVVSGRFQVGIRM